MGALSHLVRVLRIGAIALPAAAGIGYAIIYGLDYSLKLSCHRSELADASRFIAAAWLALSLFQIAGYASRPRGLDIWKIIVIAVSVLGILACWEMYSLTFWSNNCQDIGTYDYADEFLGVDLLLFLVCIPATAISGLIALFAAFKWQLRKDAEGTSPW